MQAFSNEELRSLLAAAKAKRERDWLMILVAFCHGLRATEVCGGWCQCTVNKKKEKYFHPGIRRDDVRDGHITVKRLKGSNRTVQPLMRSMDPLFSEEPALFEYARNFTGNQRIFALTRQRFFQLIREHGTTADIPRRKLHPHTLKHTIAMQSIHSAGIENVRQYLGHKSGASTMQYLKVSDADASAAVRGSIKL